MISRFPGTPWLPQAPSRRARRAESVATLPPPMTTTFLPTATPLPEPRPAQKLESADHVGEVLAGNAQLRRYRGSGGTKQASYSWVSFVKAAASTGLLTLISTPSEAICCTSSSTTDGRAGGTPGY